MADRNFDTTIINMISDLETNIPSATVSEIVNYTRVIKDLKQTENANLENLINTRLNNILQNSVTADEVAKIATSISRILDAFQPDTASGKELPRQDGNAGKFLKTDGTNLSWSNLDYSDFKDIDHTSVATNDVLVYNSTSGKYEGVAPSAVDTEVTVTGYTNKSVFPSGKKGQWAVDESDKTIYWFDGTTWKKFGTHA